MFPSTVTRAVIAVALGATAAGCDGDGRDCSQDRCAAASSRDEVLAALADHADPVAGYLRGAVTARGTLAGDYRDVLDGVGAFTGCAAESQRTFVVLSNVDLTPRPVHAQCAEDPVSASRFLMVMAGATSTDVDPQVIHMVGWDADAGEYRRYATYPDDSGEMSLNVSPSFCFGCHGGPQDLDRWQPLMNVMTNPWSGWNAEPGFESHLFDEQLAEVYRTAEALIEMTRDLDSASNLEPIVRAGLDRVTTARIKRREEPADVDSALELLRPLFCDEMVNFVSEVHGSGELRASAVIDDGLRSLLSRVSPGASWVGSTSLRLPPVAEGEPSLDLVPVRGESNVQVELGLASRGVLTAEQILRIRAVDWTRPVASAARCELYQRGRERLLAAPPDVAANNVAELLPVVFAEIMLELPVPAGADVIAIAEGGRADDGKAMTFDQFGAAIERHLADLAQSGRPAIDARRRITACETARIYPIAPLPPDITCD
jgi:hypothetical protein